VIPVEKDSKYKIGDILFHKKHNFAIYIIEKEFVGIKNFNFKKLKEKMNLTKGHIALEEWYYRLKYFGNRPFEHDINKITEWFPEIAVTDWINSKDWELQRK